MIKRMLIEAYMLVAFILLFFKGSTGQHEHEALGVVFTVLMITHLVLYRERIKVLFKQSVRMRNKLQNVNLIFLALFTLGMSSTIISGLIPSELLASYMQGIGNIGSEIRNLHPYFAYAAAVFMALHILSKSKILVKKLAYIFTH